MVKALYCQHDRLVPRGARQPRARRSSTRRASCSRFLRTPRSRSCARTSSTATEKCGHGKPGGRARTSRALLPRAGPTRKGAVERARISRSGGGGPHAPDSQDHDPRRYQELANLILTKGGRVKLVDFGMSSAPDAARRRAAHRASGAPSSPPTGYRRARATSTRSRLRRSRCSSGSPAFRCRPGTASIPLRPSSSRRRCAWASRPIPRARPGPGELVESLRSGWGGEPDRGDDASCLSDVESSTALWEGDPAAMAEALVRHDEIIAAQVEGARRPKSMGEGDSTVSVFESAPQALDAAVAATHALQEEQWPGGTARSRFASACIRARQSAAGLTTSVQPSTSPPGCAGQADGGQYFVSRSDGRARGPASPGPGARWSTSADPAAWARDTGELIHALKGPGIGAPLPAGESPYRGLLAFEPDDRRFFFGREEVVGYSSRASRRGRRRRRLGKRQVVGAARRRRRRRAGGEVEELEQRARILAPGARLGSTSRVT